MDASQLEAEQASIEEDILKLQLHSVPLNLNWDSQDEEEEEEDEPFDEEAYLLSAFDDPDQPSTSGLNNQAGPSGFVSGTTSAAPSTYAADSEDDDEMGPGDGEGELIDLSKDLEATPQNMLKLNLAYQEVLQQQLHVVQELIEQNKIKQTELNQELDISVFENQPPRPKADLGLCLAPFFKTSTIQLLSVANMTPMPLHADVKRRTEEIGELFIENPLPARKWQKHAEKKLKDGVARIGLRRLTEPLLSKLEYMEEKFKTSDDQTLKKKITEVKSKISAAKKADISELAGDIDADHDWAAISNIDMETLRTPVECALRWKNHLHPSINKSSWTAKEDADLRQIVKKHRESDWKEVASELGTHRTPMQCIQRYQQHNQEHKLKPWTPEEDEKLKKMVEKYRVGNVIPNTLIAIKMGNRSAGQVCHRWMWSVDPAYKRTRWTPDEDITLLQAIAKHGFRWAIIRDSGMVPSRNDRQCRERWENTLRNVNRTPFTKKEDAMITALVEEHGKGRWAMISKALTRRTDNQVYHRWRYIEKCQNDGVPVEYKLRKSKTALDGLAEIRQKLIDAIEVKVEQRNNNAYKVYQELEAPPEPTDEIPRLPKRQVILIEAPRGRLLGKELGKRLAEAKTSDEMVELYQDITVAVENDKEWRRRKKVKIGKWTRIDKILNDKLTAVVGVQYKPFKRIAAMEGTNINAVLKKVQMTMKKLSPKVMFIHHVKAMNINAERTLKAIKEEKPKENGAGKNESSAKVDTSATENASDSKFVRNSFLPLCAPNRATVSAYKKLMMDKERRVKRAKLMLVNKNEKKSSRKTVTITSDNAGQPKAAGNVYDGPKYEPEKLMKNIQLMPSHRILRSRFVSLFTWPTVLSTLVPYERAGNMRMLRPAIKIARVPRPSEKTGESSDDEPGPSKKRKIDKKGKE